MMRHSFRMAAVQSPIIPIIGDLIRGNPGTISLGQGIVHYGPPPQAEEGLARFLADPAGHQYGPIAGAPALIRALEAKLRAENGIDVEGESVVIVTAGANMAFMNVVLAVADPGDEFILPTPYYFNHEMAITMASCRAVPVPTDENYQIRPDWIRDAITDRTRAIVTVSPNNPSGAVYPEAALREVNALCRERGMFHISDEAYEYFTYDGVRHFSPGSIPGAVGHTLSLFSLSKAYGFASWRIGYQVIPTSLLEAVRKIQDTILICPPVVSQYAALGALSAGAAYCRGHLDGIAEVRRFALQELAAMRSFCDIPPADGAFYFLLNVHTDLGSMEVVERLIREYRVGVLPGTAFGLDEGCRLRVAFAALNEATVKEGIGRLVRGLQAIAGTQRNG